MTGVLYILACGDNPQTYVTTRSLGLIHPTEQFRSFDFWLGRVSDADHHPDCVCESPSCPGAESCPVAFGYELEAGL